MLTRRVRLTWSLPLALALAGCTGTQGEECPDDAGCAPPRLEAAPTATPPASTQPGFGGVVEVMFLIEDPAEQDVLAHRCGLTGGRRAGLATAPLPPSIREYPEPSEPADIDAAVDCMRRLNAVRRATRPL